MQAQAGKFGSGKRKQYAALNAAIGRLAQLFQRSCEFGLFSDAKFLTGQSPAAALPLYLRQLDIASLDEVFGICQAAGEQLKAVPREIKPLFAIVSLFAVYFGAVDECLRRFSALAEKERLEMPQNLVADAAPDKAVAQFLDILDNCGSIAAEIRNSLVGRQQLMEDIELVFRTYKTGVEAPKPEDLGALGRFIGDSQIRPVGLPGY